MKKIKILCSLILIIAMCASLFSGCSLFDKSPKTTEELLAKTQEAMSTIGKNMRVDIDMSLSLEMSVEQDGAELSMSMPINMNADLSMAGDYACGKTEMEGTAKVTVKYDGEKQTQEEDMESATRTYIVYDDDEVITYSKEDDGDWTYTVEDADEFDFSEIINGDVFADAEFIRDKDNKCYFIKAKLANLLNNKAIKDQMDNSEEMDIESFADAVGDAVATYKFDSEFRLVEVSLEEIELNVADLMESGALDDLGFADMDENAFVIKMAFTLKLSKFGEIKEDDVKVTNKVKDEAVKEENVDDDFGDEDDKSDDKDDEKTDDSEHPIITPDDVDVPVSDGKMSDDWTDLDITIDDVVYHFPYDYALLKTNGWAIDLEENDWEDGYVMNKNDYVNSITFYNKTYGKDWDSFVIWGGMKNYDTKAKDITQCDLWSIDLDLDVFEGETSIAKYPTIELAKGITWGATKEEIKTAYGEWDDIYESDYGYIEVEYNVDYDIYMELTIDDKLGLCAVSLSNYK